MPTRLGQALAAADTIAVTEMMAEEVTLREVTETIDGHDATVLIHSARVAAHPGWADGLLVGRPGQDGPVSDLTVFLRPLTACQALAEEMGRRTGGPRPGVAA